MASRREELLARLQRNGREQRTRQIGRLASLGTLAAGVGHDISNVILPMRGHLHCLAEGETDPVRTNHIEALAQAMNYLLQIADYLRLFAMNPDDPTAYAGSTDIQAWWKDAGTLLREAIPTHIQFGVDLDPDLPPIAVPAHRLTQAVLNLILNSSEAMPNGGHIHLWTRHEPQTDLCELGVGDDGPGMTANQRRHAFEPFFTSKQRRHATGLGLSLVHGVARRAGGFAEIQSKLGHGTKVIMHLPFATSARIVAQGSRRALVELQDSRVGACFEALLRSAGFSMLTEDRGAPVNVWVTDARLSKEVVRARLQGNPSCRIIVFGDSECSWEERITRVTRDGGLSAIRDAVNQILMTEV